MTPDLSTLPSLLRRLVTAAALVALLTALMPATVSAEPLTLRINDTAGRAGEQVAFVLRTYASRGVGQGQLCFRLVQNLNQVETGQTLGTTGPLLQLEDAVVWSANGDAMSAASFDDVTQQTVLDFSSASGTINLEDGPMAALFFRLRSDVAPGSQFEVQLDIADTFLFDPQGQPIPLELRGGELEILDPGEPHALAAEGDEVPPGAVAQIGASTEEIFPIVSGRIDLLYDPAVVSARPQVTMDPRHGAATAVVDLSQAGRVSVQFQSLGGELNEVPGQFLRVALPLRSDLDIGTIVPLSLDPAVSVLEGPLGTYPLRLEADVLTVIAAEPLFVDGFESGDLDAWSNSAP